MYESFYDLKWRPFSSTPDARNYVEVGEFEQHRNQLECTLRDGQGIAVLTSAAGLGKSMLARRVLYDLRKDFETVFLSGSGFRTRRSLLQALLYELAHPYSGMAEQELRLEFQTAVRGTCGRQSGLALVIDEVHRLHPRLLEEIRVISDMQFDGRSAVRLLLSGQLEFEEMLGNPELDALRQRLRAHVVLQPLNLAESETYISARVAAAGPDLTEVLTPQSVSVICRASDGSPRCLNQLCDHSLLLGYMAEEKPVQELTVRAALDDLKQLPLHWNDVPQLNVDLSRSPSAEAVEPQTAADGETPSPTAAGESPQTSDATPGSSVVEFGADLPNEQSSEFEIDQPDQLIQELSAAHPEPSESSVIEFGHEGPSESRASSETMDNREAQVASVSPESTAGNDVLESAHSDSDQQTEPESLIQQELQRQQQLVQSFASEPDLPDSEPPVPHAIENEQVGIPQPELPETPESADEQPVSLHESIPDLPADRRASADDFVEVPVRDPYAWIDSGRPVEDRIGQQPVPLAGDVGDPRPADEVPAGEPDLAEQPQQPAAQAPTQPDGEWIPTASEGESGTDAVQPDEMPEQHVLEFGAQPDDDFVPAARAESTSNSLPVPAEEPAAAQSVPIDEDFEPTSTERAARSLELIDRIVPLVDAALMDSSSSDETDPLAAAGISQPGGSDDTPNSAPSEEQIGAQLFDACEEIREAIGDAAHPTHEVLNAFREMVQDEAERQRTDGQANQLDTVLPDPNQPPITAGRPRPGTSGLFSRLRQKSRR